MTKKYYINDLKEFIDGARAIVFNNFGASPDSEDEGVDLLLSEVKPEEKDELDKILSQEESLIIAKQYLKTQKNKKTESIRYVLTEQIFSDILESLNSRMVSNMLNKLANDGMIESAFDEKLNDFVFWVKEKNNETEAD
jgi:hypothetical protein